jgi:hypothetical protein
VKKLLPVAGSLFLLIQASAFAQKQEQKLLERIQRPDMQLGNPLQSKSFSSVGGPGLKSAPFADKTHSTAQSGTLREFSGTRSFLGIRNPWFGQRAYDAKPASLASRVGLQTSKPYPLKGASAKPFSNAEKNANASKPAFASKPFLLDGEAQGAMRQISEKVKKEMTIDDVRELLNKPR